MQWCFILTVKFTHYVLFAVMERNYGQVANNADLLSPHHSKSIYSSYYQNVNLHIKMYCAYSLDND